MLWQISLIGIMVARLLASRQIVLSFLCCGWDTKSRVIRFSSAELDDDADLGKRKIREVVLTKNANVKSASSTQCMTECHCCAVLRVPDDSSSCQALTPDRVSLANDSYCSVWRCLWKKKATRPRTSIRENCCGEQRLPLLLVLEISDLWLKKVEVM